MLKIVVLLKNEKICYIYNMILNNKKCNNHLSEKRCKNYKKSG